MFKQSYRRALKVKSTIKPSLVLIYRLGGTSSKTPRQCYQLRQFANHFDFFVLSVILSILYLQRSDTVCHLISRDIKRLSSLLRNIPGFVDMVMSDYVIRLGLNRGEYFRYVGSGSFGDASLDSC